MTQEEINEGSRTTVVNLRREKYDVYIGRAGKGQDGYFGNPFKLTENTVQGRAKCLFDYGKYFHLRLIEDPEFKRRVHELQGKKLGCFCKPAHCHGDIIADYLNALTTPQSEIK